MSEQKNNKEYKFQKKYMHPKNRKLVDMVLNNKGYDKNTVISSPEEKKTTDREMGDEWEDDKGNVWVQKSGYKIKKSKNTETFQSVRKSLEYNCKGDCKKKKYGYTDQQLIKQAGYCTDCLAELEIEIRINGDWEDYSKLKLFHQLYKDGVSFMDNLNQAMDEVDEVVEFVDADGKVTKWELEKSVDDVKIDIQKDIDNTKDKLNEIIEKRNSYIHTLKDKNYQLVNELLMGI